MSTSIHFTIMKESYKQVYAWQQEVNQAILRHQIETRGQALVTRLGKEMGVQKIHDLPALGEAEPYFGALGGAYRYTFHPLVGGCELEVHNQMGGFAFYYPERFEPLRLFLFDPPEVIETEDETWHASLLDEDLTGLHEHDTVNSAMHFRISPLLYQLFSNWPWSRRPLYAYDFIFVPHASGSLIHIRSRESGVMLELTQTAAS